MSKHRQHQERSGGEPAWAGWAWGAAVVAGAAVAYHNSFSGPLFFDDTASIVQNESIRQWWPPGPALWPPAGAGTAGRPLLNYSYALNYALGGLAVEGYHAVNWAIHAAAGLVLFGLVRRTLRLPRLREKFGEAATELGGLSALLWVVHPLQTESVTYVSQRAESLVGFFYLLTWYAFVRRVESDERGGRDAERRMWSVVAVAACVAGVLTKEIMVTAPVVILGFDRWFVAGRWRDVWGRGKRFYLSLLSAWGLLVVMMLSSRLHERGVGFGGKVPWLESMATACEGVALYLKLSVWPAPLVIDYGETPLRGGVMLAASAVLVGLWVAGAIWAGRRLWISGFVGWAVLALLAPTSSVVPVIFQPIAEHRMYLPLAPLVVLAVAGGFAWAGRRAVLLGLAVALGFIGLTVRRNEDYRSEEVIWRDVIAKRPDNWRAHNALGLELLRQQRIAEGVAALETAVRRNPTEPKLLNNYANALALPMVARWSEAIAAGERAVQLDPRYAEARNSLAQVLRQVGRWAEAAGQFEAARKLQPDAAEIRSNLCDALRLAGRPTEAVEEGEAAVRLKPEFAAAYGNLGLALAAAGRFTEAEARYETALRLRPTYVEVRNNFAVLLINRGRHEEALAHLAEAIRFKPDYAEAHNSRGIACAQLGRIAEAADAFETALRLKPDYVMARENLGLLRTMAEKKAAPRQ